MGLREEKRAGISLINSLNVPRLDENRKGA